MKGEPKQALLSSNYYPCGKIEKSFFLRCASVIIKGIYYSILANNIKFIGAVVGIGNFHGAVKC
jgi:hypothetical protein